ncbi:hypothetical protein [Streptosporangium jomthongense]|uniref:Uncharacterized protein n=1 Tax=Streptosporangium jomthongense TaxID=1193683 RepID=A0ABV8EW97_9ACTN
MTGGSLALRARYLLNAALAVVVLVLTICIDGIGLTALFGVIAVLFFLVCAFRA